MSSEEDTGPSELGTKEYWDRTYELEMNNFQSHGDVGEEWFGEDTAIRMVRWVVNSELVSKEASIVDIGCGNGMMLTSLAEEGFERLMGVDYSAGAVKLANAVAAKMELNIKYEEWDLLGSNPCPGAPHFLALDKGTYDAVGLSQNGAAARATYASRLHELLQPGGLLVITSCNWTRSELEQIFTPAGFSVLKQLPAPTFKFGGSEGSLVTSLVFQRDKNS